MKNQAILRAKGAEQVVLDGVSAKGRVSGLFLELTVEQRYRNPSAKNIEAVYTFPLPWSAVLMSLEFDISGKTLAGVVVPRAEGEARYEGAIDKGDTAVLVERASDGLYTANVGNLMPGEKAVVRYRYAQLLRFDKGQVRLTSPRSSRRATGTRRRVPASRLTRCRASICSRPIPSTSPSRWGANWLRGPSHRLRIRSR